VTTHPSLAASRAAGLSNGEAVTITGTGFTPYSPGQVVECNLTPGEPANGFGYPTLPIGCTSVFPALSNPIRIGFRTSAAPPVMATPAVTGGRMAACLRRRPRRLVRRPRRPPRRHLHSRPRAPHRSQGATRCPAPMSHRRPPGPSSPPRPGR